MRLKERGIDRERILMFSVGMSERERERKRERKKERERETERGRERREKRLYQMR